MQIKSTWHCEYYILCYSVIVHVRCCAAQVFPLNPKSITMGELYGESDVSSNEWSDGVLSSIMRVQCADERPDEKWILFDGPVDTLWIESMNSLMDDNKVLTLINGERISMPEQVSLLFEVEDLSVASPATVSRCGMVYTEYRDLSWKPFVESWLARKDKVLYMNCSHLVYSYIYSIYLVIYSHTEQFCIYLICVHHLLASAPATGQLSMLYKFDAHLCS